MTARISKWVWHDVKQNATPVRSKRNASPVIVERDIAAILDVIVPYRLIFKLTQEVLLPTPLAVIVRDLLSCIN
jgi:hypothetical protein